MPAGESAWGELDAAWEAALAPINDADTAPVVLFSGGVDSGLLAWDLLRRGPARLATVGTEGAEDVRRASAAAEVLRQPLARTVVDDLGIRRILTRIAPELEGVARPRRAIFVALAAAIDAAPSGGIVCGQGPDELFLGYAHYRGLAPRDAAARSARDLATLLEHDWPRTEAIARRLGRAVQAPYLDPAFVRAASAIPIADRLPGAEAKPAFRAWAVHRGLPEPLARAPKRAIQYGSGIERRIRSMRRGPS